MPKELAQIGLVALAGLLIGGVYSAWKTTKLMAMVLAAAALVAIGGAIAWFLS